MKKRFLVLVSICLLFSSVFVPVMAEDSNINVMIKNISSEDANSDIVEDITFEDEILSERITVNENEFTSSNIPRYTSGIKLFSFCSPELSDEQKAAKVRDFILERLNNMEAYREELSLDKNTATDMLFIDLSGLSEVELYYDTAANKNSTKKILRNAISDIQNKSPRTFWCDFAYTWSWGSDCKLTKLGIQLNCDMVDVADGVQSVIDEVNALTAEFDGYVQSIVELIPDYYSDYEKILFVNDYLCTNYKYDTRCYTNNAAELTIYNAYDFFKEGKGVCQAYTLAFIAIMDELGIRCDAVSSVAMEHIWNLVELNGKWYHIDVTWNDPCFPMLENDTLGKACHKYFLLSSERIENIDAYPDNHYGFDVEGYGYEIGTEYDEVEVDLSQSLRTSFIELNSIWYTTDYNDATRKCGLYALDSPDISSIKRKDFKTPICNIGLWRTADNAYYPCSFSYLAKYNDVILFNTPTSICVFDGKEVSELYVPKKQNDEKIYGFTIRGNEAWIQLATNPNQEGIKKATLEKVNLDELVTCKLIVEDYSKVTKKATIYATQNIEATLIFASYEKNGKLIDCKPISCSGKNQITKGTRKYASPNGFNTNGAEKVKIMIWDKESRIKPLCEVLEK